MRKILVLVMMCLPFIAYAETPLVGRFYVHGFGGVNFIEDYKSENITVEYDPGYVAGGGLGFRLGNYFRIELEAAFRSNDFDQIKTDVINIPVTGLIEKITLIGNAIVEIPICSFNIFAGGGFGGRWDHESVTIDPITIDGETFRFPKIVGHSDSNVYQAIGGFSYCIARCSTLGAEYRYLNGELMQANHSVSLNLKICF